jgi:hypothetical protein
MLIYQTTIVEQTEVLNMVCFLKCRSNKICKLKTSLFKKLIYYVEMSGVTGSITLYVIEGAYRFLTVTNYLLIQQSQKIIDPLKLHFSVVLSVGCPSTNQTDMWTFLKLSVEPLHSHFTLKMATVRISETPTKQLISSQYHHSESGFTWLAVDSSGKADFYSGGARIESRTGPRSSWLVFLWFSSIPQVKSRYSTSKGPCPLSSISFKFRCSLNHKIIQRYRDTDNVVI